MCDGLHWVLCSWCGDGLFKRWIVECLVFLASSLARNNVPAGWQVLKKDLIGTLEVYLEDPET
jgi:hypothetical protein